MPGSRSSSYYVPKLVYGGSTYCFVGLLPEELKNRLVESSRKPLTAEDKQKLEAVLGKSYKKTLLLKSSGIKYVSDTIRYNDTVGMLRKKVCIALGKSSPDDLYFWYQRSVAQDPVFVYHFIHHVFKKNRAIPFERLARSAESAGMQLRSKDYNMVTREEATSLLFAAVPSTVSESLCFHYMFDGFKEFFPGDPVASKNFDARELGTSTLGTGYMTSLLNTYDVLDDTFYVSDDHASLPDFYFPFRAHGTKSTLKKEDIQLIQSIDELEKKVEAIDVSQSGDIRATTVINVIHLKGNDIPGINGLVDMEHLFNSLSTSESIPFIKYKTPSNAYYRIHKSALNKIPATEYQRWTRVSASKDDKSFIVVKLLHHTSFVSMTFNADLSFMVKTTLSIKEARSVKDVSDAILPQLNAILSKVAQTYPHAFVPTIPMDILTSSKDTDIVRVIQMITSTVMHVRSSKLNLAYIPQVVKMHMYPYFNMIQSSDPTVLHLQYKKVNNYTKLDNISAYITLNSKMDRNELISEIISTFMVSKEEADREIDAWFAVHAEQLEGITNEKRRGGKRLFDTSNLVNIKIKLNSVIDLKYLTNGVANVQMDDDITLLIQKLLILTEQHKKSQKKTTISDTLEKLEKQAQPLQPLMTAAVVAVDVDDDVDDIEVNDDDDDSSVMSGDDEDLLALQQEFAEDKNEQTSPSLPAPVVVDEPPTTQGKAKVKGYILNKLYEADKGLFEYKPPPEVKRRDYASLCGWVDRRQPVVVNKEELDRIEKEFPKAVNGFVRSGSTPQHYQRNYYICPKVWCPKSRVAMSAEDYEKHGRKCPYPNIEEEPILFASKSFFGEGDAGLKKERYPGYLDKYIHPEHLCLPCCFKVKPSEGNRNKQRGDMCVLKDKNATTTTEEAATGAAEDNDVVKDKYIKSSNYSPLEQGRYGLLPPQLAEYLQQTSKQGNRHDGTGSITDQTDALVRRGLLQTGQSYLDAIVNIIDNPDIRTPAALVDIIVKRLDVLTYMSLENGRIMKMFMTTSKSIYDATLFREFYQWFKLQQKYIVQMSLQRLLKEMEEGSSVSFRPSDMPHHHEIMREFLIYQSFQSFKDYLKNERVVKEHLVLGDLVCNYIHKYLNVHRYNIIHMEYNVEQDKVHTWCPVNKDKTYDVNYPFVFLLRRNAYYEPLVQVRQTQGDMDITHTFHMGTMKPILQKLVKFIMNNCGGESVKSQPLDIIIDFCKGIGYKVKYVVVDYGYKVCGLVLFHNLYVPLEHREDFYFHTGVKYMYINDVTNLKCLLEQSDVRKVFTKIAKFTRSTFYDIQEFTDGGLMLRNNNYVPLKPPKDRVYFKNGLFILIGYEAMDRRRELTATFENEVAILQQMSNKIQERMRNDPRFSKEVGFLLDKHNPLPIVYRTQKLRKLVQLEESTDHGPLLYKLMDYLRHPSRHYRMYMRRVQRFTSHDDEMLMDHFDIQNGRLKGAIEVAENPHRAFLNVVDELMNQSFTFDDIMHNNDEFQDILDDTKYEDVPVKWRKILRGWKVIGNNDAYEPRYMQKIFQRIHAKAKGRGASFTDELYELSYTQKLTQAYQEDNVTEVFDNPWLVHHFKKTKQPQTMDNVLDTYASIHYYPSIFDIKLMSHLAKVNLVLIGRKTTRNPDGLEVIKNSPSNLWVVLLFAFDRHFHHDRFNFFTHKGHILFTTGELNDEFATILSQKMTEYDVEVVEDR